MQDWNQIMRRLSGVLGTVGMCWELVNREWTVWMPARLLQSLSVKESGVSFQDHHFLAIRSSREDNLCNEMSQDSIIMCHSSSTLYMMSYVTFLQALRHNFCNRREQKWNRLFTRPIFPCVAKNGLEMRLRLGCGVGNTSLVSRLFGGEGKERAWYLLFAHALN